MRPKFLVPAFCIAVLFVVALPRANAALPTSEERWLTGTQIQAIINLLRSFGVDPPTLVKVNAVLIRKPGPTILITPAVVAPSTSSTGN